jgi:phosphate acyltransferase
MDKITVALDGMGGDDGHDIVIPASLAALKRHKNLHLVLVGDETVLEPLLPAKFIGKDRLTICHASQIVGMDESPATALRYKKDSSMRVAINLVKAGTAQACVSAGNTGALMATARFVLKTLPGIDRPAIICSIPAENKLRRVRILDLGANVDSSVEQLFQFSVMGAVLTSAVDDIDLTKVKVALLNIGSEEIKGNEQVKQTAKLLSECEDINYIGYVEGDGIFKGVADVIVCDGFVGNVALKSIEGVSKFLAKTIKAAFSRNFLTKLAGASAIFVLKSLKKTMNPERYNGATLVGLNGIVIKSHGGTSVVGFAQAIKCAVDEVEHNVPTLIKAEVEKLLATNK